MIYDDTDKNDDNNNNNNNCGRISSEAGGRGDLKNENKQLRKNNSGRTAKSTHTFPALEIMKAMNNNCSP